MSKAQSIQKKLHKAYGKVGKVLGEPYEVYRADSIDTPLVDSNVIDIKSVAFSKDEKFKKSDSAGESRWLCWIDGQLETLFDVQVGDYLKNVDTGVVYYIVSASNHIYIQAIKTHGTVTITRTGYGDTGSGFSSNAQTTVGSNIPADIHQPSSGGSGGYVPAQTHSRDALPTYHIHINDVHEEVRVKDVVLDEDGNESQVIAVYRDDIGTTLTTQAQTP